jgi:MFS family permease
MAAGYALIYFFGANIVTFFIAMTIVGMGWASLVSLPFAIMSERVDQSKMGLYMGIFNLSVVLPQLVASFKMGEVIGAAADKSVIFAICAVCLAISGLLWIFVKNNK